MGPWGGIVFSKWVEHRERRVLLFEGWDCALRLPYMAPSRPIEQAAGHRAGEKGPFITQHRLLAEASGAIFLDTLRALLVLRWLPPI